MSHSKRTGGSSSGSSSSSPSFPSITSSGTALGVVLLFAASRSALTKESCVQQKFANKSQVASYLLRYANKHLHANTWHTTTCVCGSLMTTTLLVSPFCFSSSTRSSSLVIYHSVQQTNIEATPHMNTVWKKISSYNITPLLNKGQQSQPNVQAWYHQRAPSGDIITLIFWCQTNQVVSSIANMSKLFCSPPPASLLSWWCSAWSPSSH